MRWRRVMRLEMCAREEEVCGEGVVSGRSGRALLLESGVLPVSVMTTVCAKPQATISNLISTASASSSSTFSEVSVPSRVVSSAELRAVFLLCVSNRRESLESRLLFRSVPEAD